MFKDSPMNNHINGEFSTMVVDRFILKINKIALPPVSSLYPKQVRDG